MRGPDMTWIRSWRCARPLWRRQQRTLISPCLAWTKQKIWRKIQPWHLAAVPRLRTPFRLAASFGLSPPPPDIKAYLWKEIEKCYWGDIVVLGLERELTLRGIGEELNGRTHLYKPYVAKKTILCAVRRQNEVIMDLQAKTLYAL